MSVRPKKIYKKQKSKKVKKGKIKKKLYCGGKKRKECQKEKN